MVTTYFYKGYYITQAVSVHDEKKNTFEHKNRTYFVTKQELKKKKFRMVLPEGHLTSAREHYYRDIMDPLEVQLNSLTDCKTFVDLQVYRK